MVLEMPYNRAMRHHHIRCEWDKEASVWYVAESNVPGLCTEAPTEEAMIEKLTVLVPELLELNSAGKPTDDVPVTLLWKREQELRIPPA
jgi:Domain of unknown function (DUF1902)